MPQTGLGQPCMVHAVASMELGVGIWGVPWWCSLACGDWPFDWCSPTLVWLCRRGTLSNQLRWSSIGSQDHSSYLPAAESFLSLTLFVCWLRSLIFQLETRPWMSPYMKSIREHWCWPRLCLHSLLLEARITQSRHFGFVKRFSREISNWTKPTQSNNWVTFSPKVSQKLFSNISKRRSRDGNSFYSLVRIRTLNIRFQSREGVLYQVIYLVLYCWFLGGKGTPGMFDPVL